MCGRETDDDDVTDAGELQGLGKGAMKLADCADEEELVDSGEEFVAFLLKGVS